MPDHCIPAFLDLRLKIQGALVVGGPLVAERSRGEQPEDDETSHGEHDLLDVGECEFANLRSEFFHGKAPTSSRRAAHRRRETKFLFSSGLWTVARVPRSRETGRSLAGRSLAGRSLAGRGLTARPLEPSRTGWFPAMSSARPDWRPASEPLLLPAGAASRHRTSAG